MKKNYFRLRIFFTGLLFAMVGNPVLNAQLTVDTYTYTGTIQNFTVPTCVYSLTIQAKGAQGGFHTTSTTGSGLGADMKGTFAVTPGQVLKVLVGQQPSLITLGNGGGGGTFVTDLSNNPLIVAGGGGGSSQGPDSPNKHGQVGTAGAPGSGGGGAGGTNGNGGSIGGSFTSGAGGGLLTNGATGWTANTGGIAFVNGGLATTQAASGGFGGGGSGSAYVVGGGGGGYSGGGAGSNSSGNAGVGGGGGSFNGGTNQVNIGGANSGHGQVIFTYQPGSPISATVTPTVICSGNTATLQASGVSTYTWVGMSSNATSITVSPTANTSYTVQGTNPLGCTTTVVLNVGVNSAVPTLTVVNSAAAFAGICPNASATLTASGAITYTWAGGTPVTNGVSFSPTTPSDYTVTGENACGTSTAVTSISVHPLPIINASASTSSLCSGTSLTLSASGNYTNHTWAGGYTSGVGFFPTLTNTYVATATSSLSCTNTAAVIVTVVTTPALSPTGPPLICFGQSATLTATGATNYTWLPGPANTSSIVVSPAVTTTYTVIKSNANCVDTKSFVLNVNALPGVFAIVTPTVICALKTATLFGGGAQTFTWTAPSFSTTGLGPLVAPAIPTTYTVTGSDGICTNTTTVFLAVDPNPTITTSATPSVVCLGDTTTLIGNGGINYTWTATTGTVFTSTFTDTPMVPTLYSVTGDNSFGCVASSNQIVLVNQLPPVTVAANKTLVCVGGDAKLTANGANTYQWDAGAGGAITSTVMVNPQTTSSYTVEGTATATGCKNRKSITITVFAPTVAVSTPTSTCYGGNVTISASGATSYTWHLGNGVTHLFSSALVSPTALTVYTVTALTSTIGGLSCPSSNTTSIDIFYNPTITATSDRPSICKNESVKLFGTGGDFYLWNDPQSQNGATITVSPQLQTTYTVTGTDSHGCVSTGTVMVKVSPCVGLNEFNADNFGVSIYPNPNDGNFTILSEEDITLTLSNELGQVLRIIELSASHTKVSVDDLPKGIYFISGQKNNLTVNQKIIVTK